MRTFFAFFKKELTEQIRTGRLIILGIIFVLFGIMSPAIAKLTPWMMNLFSEQLAESGMHVSQVTVDALTSWTQFYKNIPIALIIFVLILCGTLTSECQKGTLIPMLTKGLSRTKVIGAKLLSLSLLWTGGYYLCYGITYAYTMYFWDNTIAHSLCAASLAYYLFGLWVISLMILFSSFSPANTGVLLGTGGICLMAYLLSLLPKVQPYTPMALAGAMPVVNGVSGPESLAKAAIVTAVLFVANSAASFLIFNKRKI